MSRTLRIFVSSPGDVGQERFLVERVIERLQGEFINAVKLEPFLWEHEPVRATTTFQQQLERPSEANVVIIILWSRLGTRLPEGFERRPDGSPYESGTAFEFEDAKRAYEERGEPDLLVYRKTAEPLASIRDLERLREAAEQWSALERYLNSWFRNKDGSFKAGFTEFESPEAFEQVLERHLRQLIRAKLKAPDVSPLPDFSATIWHRGSPFRGLNAFEFKHAPIFFGRTRAISKIRDSILAQAMRGQAFVLVLGMSGCGKSSLLKAGVLPMIMHPGAIEGVGAWRWCTFRPSEVASGGLIGGLSAAMVKEPALPELIRLGWDRERLAAQLTADVRMAPAVLEQALSIVSSQERVAAGAQARLAVIVDQMEEVFTTQSSDKADQAAFVDLLATLARSGLAWVLCAMRSDYYHRCAELPSLVALAEGEGQYHLLPPSAAEIAQIVRGPARAAGLRFDIDPETKEGLDDVLHQAAAASPSALPLLEFTLDELFLRRTAENVLTFDAYRELGGLEGALASHAENVFLSLAPDVQAELPAVVRALITIGINDGAAAALAQPVAVIMSTQERRTLVEAFVAARLFVTDQNDQGEAIVRLTHEALLVHWPRVEHLIKTDRDFLSWRQRLRIDLQNWQRLSADESTLLRGAALAEAQRWWSERFTDLNKEENDFIQASLSKQAAEERKRRRRFGIAVATAVVAIFLAAFAGLQYWRAEQQQEVAEQRRQEAEEENQKAKMADARRLAGLSRQRTAAGDATMAMLLAREALSSDRPEVPEAEAALYEAVQAHREMAILGGHTGSIRHAEFSPDGGRLVTASDDGTARVWDSVHDLSEALLKGHEGTVFHAAFSGDGRRIITASSDRTARLWNAVTGELLGVLSGHGGWVTIACFSPDSRRAATASTDGTVRIWDVETGQTTAVLPAHGKEVTAVSFGPDPDRNRLLTASSDGTVRVWDVTSGREIFVLQGHKEPVWHAAFSPDGKRIVTSSGDDTARLWDGEDGDALWSLDHRGDVNHAEFNSDGSRVATASNDRTARVWDVRSGAEVLALTGHGDRVNRVVFSPDGLRIATISSDRTARLWDAATGNTLAVVASPEKSMVNHISFSPDGERIVTSHGDGTARIWKASGSELVVLRGHVGIVQRVAFSPGGDRVATASSDRTARLWDAATGMPLVTLSGHDDVIWDIDFSPSDGSRILTASSDGSVRVWDARSGDELRILPVAEGAVRRAAFMGTGEQVVTVIDTGVANLWNVANGENLGIIDGNTVNAPPDIVWEPDGPLALTILDRAVEVKSRATDKVVAVLSGHEGAVLFAGFSPDGTRIVTTSEDRTARLWDASSGVQIAVFHSHNGTVTHAAFSPEGRRIVTGSHDRTARIYEIFPTKEELLDYSRKLVSRDLSDQERQRFFLP